MGKKTGTRPPRRTMSMSKKASKLAEDAAGLDLLEEAIGNPETDGPNGGPRFDTLTLVAGWGLAMLSVVAILFTVKAVFPSADTDYAMLPDGYRAAVGLPGAALASNADGITPLEDMIGYADPAASTTRGIFPDATTQQPVILEVTCPPGSVEISTGARVVDTVCVRGQLVGQVPAAASVPVAPTPIIIVVPANGGPAIGSTTVPDDLDCQEDEVIGFAGVPDTLVCVHVDTLPASGAQ